MGNGFSASHILNAKNRLISRRSDIPAAVFAADSCSADSYSGCSVDSCFCSDCFADSCSDFPA